jgi:hypothetical protein
VCRKSSEPCTPHGSKDHGCLVDEFLALKDALGASSNEETLDWLFE